MTELWKSFRWFIIGAIITGCSLALGFPGKTEMARLVASRFLTGFARFLSRNLPEMSPNAATWVPGLAAFVIGTAALHLLIATPLRRRCRQWTITQSLALALLLPVHFAIAFIVPGILLNALPLTGEQWFQEWPQ